MNRRTFLNRGLQAGVLGWTGMSLQQSLFASTTDRKIPIGLELYSLRRTIQKDIPGTLKKVREFGYLGVETAGLYNLAPSVFRKYLEDADLKTVSAHISLNALLGEQFAKTVDTYKELGIHRLLVSGGLYDAIRTNAGNWMTAHLFNEIASKAAAVGFEIGFHCHSNDFERVPDRNGKLGLTAWELFLQRTNKEVIGQIDIGWCNHSGNDPAAMIRKFPGRAKIVHVKSHNENINGCVVADADDKVKWPEVIKACAEVGGTEWLIVEQEQFKVSELDSVHECIKNLKSLGLV